jgi:hypothetical protein
VAGYLSIKSDLKSFRKFLLNKGDPFSQSQLIHAILNNYNEIRNNFYGKPTFTVTEKDQTILNISVKYIWAALVDSNYDILFINIVNLPFYKD